MKIKLSTQLAEKNINVNIIRFLAALAVIICHSFYISVNRPDFLESFTKGQINLGGVAVGIFFFYSGLYVTKSLEKSSSVKEFMWKRCKRIFPQLWLTVGICTFVLGPVLTELDIVSYVTNGQTYKYLLNGILIPIHNLPGVFTENVYGMAVNGPLWTMPVEFATYCSLAVMYIFNRFLFKGKNGCVFWHTFALIACFLLTMGSEYILNNAMLVSVFRALAIFYAGAFGYDVAKYVIIDCRIAFLFLVILGICCKTGGLNAAFILLSPYIILSLSFGVKQTRMESVLLQISYEMYLVGWPIQQVITSFFGGTMQVWLNIVLTIPVDIVIGFLLYKLVAVMESR